MTIAIWSAKGGVGKTTVAVNLAVMWAMAGQRVLLLDLDGQYSATSFFGEPSAPECPSIYHTLWHETPLEAGAREIATGFWMVPGDARLIHGDRQLPDLPGADLRLKRAIGQAQKSEWGRFDRIVIDAPGGWGALARNALGVGTHHLMPLGADVLGLEPALDSRARALAFYEAYDREPAPFAALLTLYRDTSAGRDLETAANAQWGADVLQSRIFYSEAWKKMAGDRKTVAQRQAGRGREDVVSLAKELDFKWKE